MTTTISDGILIIAAVWLLALGASVGGFAKSGSRNTGEIYTDNASPDAALLKKKSSVFMPNHYIDISVRNAKQYPWAAEIHQSVIEAAQPWLKYSDNDLWNMMFGNTISRSWMVWSDGYCPACRAQVPMYTWIMNPFDHPWKTQCPHCAEFFPKNDFHQFYQSGLDDRNVFDPARADSSLLFNADHPDPADPLHLFGVDDGEGFLADGHRWRFIGAYLIYGHWKKLIVDGICNLAAAYSVTGELRYAHKAAILLDRVADLYSTFDFGREGIVYERKGDRGYVSTWHDACEETRRIALAYDQIFEVLADDRALVGFLSVKAAQHQLSNPKASFLDIQRNIESGILREVIQNSHKIETNYPRKEFALLTMKTILEWPHNRTEVMALLDSIISTGTAVDGLTGEKGLVGYAKIGPRSLAQIIGHYSRIEPGFMKMIFEHHPRLYDTYRFHIDTWCLHEYYPNEGDGGTFGKKLDRYIGLEFPINPGILPSNASFFSKLYELTDDPSLLQVLHHANGSSVDGLPHDLFAENPAEFQRIVRDVISKHGVLPEVGSINKKEWHLAILRSGTGPLARALWLDYDSGGRHCHADGMNIGLFAKGLDLMPDFGYPPVQYGGWESPKAMWYRGSTSHNLVVVNGKRLSNAEGETTLWGIGKGFRVVRASAAELIEGNQYERTVALIDISERDAYALDILRVVGGTDHAKFMHSSFGTFETSGLRLSSAPEYGHGAQMRNFQADPAPKPGWSVDWKIDDRYGYLSADTDIHLRYVDLTDDAQAMTAESWVSISGFNSADEAWIPTVVTRRRAAEGDTLLASTFVNIIEPYEGASNISNSRRMTLNSADGSPCAASNVAVEIQLADGRSDLIVALDVEDPLQLNASRDENELIIQPDWVLKFCAELCCVRKHPDGTVQSIVMGQGDYVRIGEIEIELTEKVEFIEIDLDEKQIRVPGMADDFQSKISLKINGKDALSEFDLTSVRVGN